jgi:hypothetical protein
VTGPYGNGDRVSRSIDRFPVDEQIVVRAAELVSRDWCRDALAEDQAGRRVEPWSDSARSWSTLGALINAWAERGAGRFDTLQIAYEAVALATGGRVEEWNAARWRTKWHVLSALARARMFLPQARQRVRAGCDAPSSGAAAAAQHSRS